MSRTTKETYSKDEIKEIREKNPSLKELSNKELMERLAYYNYDLKHNCSIMLGRVTNNSFEIVEMD